MIEALWGVFGDASLSEANEALEVKDAREAKDALDTLEARAERGDCSLKGSPLLENRPEISIFTMSEPCLSLILSRNRLLVRSCKDLRATMRAAACPTSSQRLAIDARDAARDLVSSAGLVRSHRGRDAPL